MVRYSTSMSCRARRPTGGGYSRQRAAMGSAARRLSLLVYAILLTHLSPLSLGSLSSLSLSLISLSLSSLSPLSSSLRLSRLTSLLFISLACLSLSLSPSLLSPLLFVSLSLCLSLSPSSLSSSLHLSLSSLYLISLWLSFSHCLLILFFSINSTWRSQSLVHRWRPT